MKNKRKGISGWWLIGAIIVAIIAVFIIKVWTTNRKRTNPLSAGFSSAICSVFGFSAVSSLHDIYDVGDEGNE